MSLDYNSAATKLTGRCKKSRRLCNNTYLHRRTSDSIAVRLHSTDVVTFYADGRITINTGGWNTVTTKDRIRAYSPVCVWTESGHPFASYNNQTVALVGGRRADVLADGTLTGDSAEDERKEIREERNAAMRPHNRARYWVRRARGIFVDSDKCTQQYGHTRWQRARMQLGTHECGCVVYHEAYKGKLTVEKIMLEENAAVRVAKMTCYGIERFFLDSNAAILDTRDGYQLLQISVGQWERLRAIKMECTTTKAVYVSSVPPNVKTVAEALDWMFNTTDYLGTVGQQA